MKKKEMYEAPSVQACELAMENTILDASVLTTIALTSEDAPVINDITYGGSF